MTPCMRRNAEIHFTRLAFLGSVLLLTALVALLVWDPLSWFLTEAPSNQPLVVYCAAGVRRPVEEIARQYEEEFGVPVQLQYDGSQNLLNSIVQVRKGDLYLPGDDSYLSKARADGLVRETLPLATMTPMLAVPTGNPQGITSLDDVFAKKLRIAQADPDAAAVGKLAREALGPETWEELQERVVVSKFTVNQVANAVAVGGADAGIVWDVTVRQYPEKLEEIHLPSLEGRSARVAVGVLADSEQPTAALRFARYLAAREKGLPAFAAHGFVTAEGDVWEEEPRLLLLAGAMLRPAIEETLEEFRKREGVEITTVYNGCGILVGQMKTGEHSPDAYFACDQTFMAQVSYLFETPLTVSGNQLVILVPKGNPQQIHSLDDLGKPGLRVGVGHEKQCAMGALTQQTLKEGGVRARVMQNVKVQKPTGDMLVSDLLAGSLDAVIAYISNGAQASDRLDAVAIAIPCAFANQPIAINKASKHKQLTGRLIEAILTRESRRRFEAYGFKWKVGTGR
jgi:molybdate transport system substrate-binding protein